MDLLPGRSVTRRFFIFRLAAFLRRKRVRSSASVSLTSQFRNSRERRSKRSSSLGSSANLLPSEARRDHPNVTFCPPRQGKRLPEWGAVFVGWGFVERLVLLVEESWSARSPRKDGSGLVFVVGKRRANPQRYAESFLEKDREVGDESFLRGSTP